MRRSTTACAATMATLALVGCLAPRATSSRPGAQQARAEGGHALVLSEEAFATASKSLLSILRDRVGGMRVDRTTACPAILLRGRRSILGSNDPGIYVDGTRTSDTCVLEMISVVDVERVEVYRMGVTTRPGYHPNPNGLILIFTRTGRE